MAFALLAVAVLAAPVPAAAPAPRFGSPYRVTLKNAMRGTLDGPDGKPVAIVGEAVVVFRERAAEPGGGDRSVRFYERMDYARSVDGAKLELRLRDKARRVIVDRDPNGETIYSPDAPLRMPEIDLIASQTAVGLLANLAAPPATGARDSWIVPEEAAAEFAGIARLESGRLEAADQGTVDHMGKPLRKLRISGSVIGPTPDGRGRNNLEGEALIDPSTKRVTRITARGTRQILGVGDKPIGRFEVDYELAVDPLDVDADAELANAWLNTIPNQPLATWIEVEWEDPRRGLLLRHGREWTERLSSSGDLVLTRGPNSVAIHPEEPGKVPSTDQYLAEARRYLEELKAAPRLTRPKREVESPAGRLGNFQLAATLDGAPTILDYWVVERGKRGVTIAGRLAIADAPALTAVLETLARSVRFLPSPADSRR